MKFNELIKNMEVTGPRLYYLFETYLMTFLKYHLKQIGKKIYFPSSSYEFGFDAIAPDGFDELIGKTILEFKYSSNPRYLFLYFDKLNSQTIPDFDNFLLIYGQVIPRGLKEKIIKRGSELFQGKKFVLWDSSDIEKLENKYPDISNNILNNLNILRIEKSLERKSTDWIEERKRRLDQLAKQCERGGLSFVLGAGVSIDAGLPSWNDLLRALYSKHLEEIVFQNQNITFSDIKYLVKVLEKIEFNSALMAARYIRRGLCKNDDSSDKFISIVRESLYQYESASARDSKLLNTISELCVPKKTGVKIDSIITYNFDDLLENEFDTKHLLYRSIYRDGDSPTRDELPIYHVHGFLPQEPSKYQNLSESLFVFSEENYHEIFSEPYHWSNLVQLTTFREKVCIMVGLSMTDPNLRRLLEIAARKFYESKHFVFLQRASINNILSQMELGNSFIDNTKIDQFQVSHYNLYEDILEELGVSIIWYENFKEIPELLKMISVI